MTESKRNLELFEAVSAKSQQTPELKIAVLHGYRDNVEKVSRKLAAWEQALRTAKIDAHWTYLSAPHKYEPLDGHELKDEDEKQMRQWWASDKDILFTETKFAGQQESIDFLDSKLCDLCPDVLIGFSQGASMSTLFLNHRLTVAKSKFHKGGWQHPRALVLIGAFLSKFWLDAESYPSTAVGPFYADRVASMHVMGEKDDLVAIKDSMQVARLFQDPVIHKHPGGHFVPSRSADKKAFVAFCASLLKM
jgi:predicted esterase